MGDARRLRRFLTQALNLVGLVVAEVTFEPEPLAFFDVAFPREDVGTGAVEEPCLLYTSDAADDTASV